MARHGGPHPVTSPGREIRYCRAPDGTSLAFGVAGQGPLLLALGAFATHLGLDHQHPVLRAGLAALQREFTVLRYDERGHGLSAARGRDDLATRVGDLGSVVDAAGWDRFAILAVHMGGPVGIAYAAEHPRRVSQLVLAATFARGPALVDHSLREALLFARLISEGWAGSARTRRVLSAGIVPGASEETLAWLDQAQPALGARQTLAASYWNQVTADASDRLWQVRTPTLVIHARDDLLVGLDEARRVATAIPDARLVTFADGGNVMPEHPSAWEPAVREIATLVSGATRSPPPPAPGLAALSPREWQILELLARGMSNPQISAQEYLSLRTVERHVSNIYGKLHLSGSTSRTSAVALFLRRGAAVPPRLP